MFVPGGTKPIGPPESCSTRMFTQDGGGRPATKNTAARSKELSLTPGEPVEREIHDKINRQQMLSMIPISRRKFMEKAVFSSGAVGFLAASASNLSAAPLGLPIGSQVWPTRSMIKDFPAYVKMMADIGV